MFMVIDRFRFFRSTFETAEKNGNSLTRSLTFFWLCNSFSFRFLACRVVYFVHDDGTNALYFVKLMNGSRTIKYTA